MNHIVIACIANGQRVVTISICRYYMFKTKSSRSTVKKNAILVLDRECRHTACRRTVEILMNSFLSVHPKKSNHREPNCQNFDRMALR